MVGKTVMALEGYHKPFPIIHEMDILTGPPLQHV